MISVTVETSTRCGADCLACVRKKMPNANLVMENSFFFHIIDELQEFNAKTDVIKSISFVGWEIR